MSKLNKSSVLWIIFISISLALLLLTQTGPGLTLEFVAVTVPAIFCWLKFSFNSKPDRAAAVPFYILSITFFLILCTARFSADYGLFLKNNFGLLFKNTYELTTVNWFLVMVCIPASVMLTGGYLLVKGITEGAFFAWWTFFFCITESLVQFVTELIYGQHYTHRYYLGALTATILFLLGAYGIVALLRHSTEHQLIAPYPSPARRRTNLWSVLFITLVILYGISLYSQAGILPVGVIAGSMMGGMIGWRKTTSWFPADPYKLVPLYLLLQALFYVHVGEETLTHFNRGIAAISGHPWTDSEFTYLIALIGPVIWVFAAWSLWKGQAFGNFILWFMIIGMILGEPTHVLVFPVIRMVKEGVGYEYFSGMYTALFPMIPAIIALTVIIRDHKKRKAVYA